MPFDFMWMSPHMQRKIDQTLAARPEPDYANMVAWGQSKIHDLMNKIEEGSLITIRVAHEKYLAKHGESAYANPGYPGRNKPIEEANWLTKVLGMQVKVV